MTTVREQIKIIQAYERGEEIEYRQPSNEWFTLLSKEEFIKEMGYECEFNFSEYEYRIKRKRWRAKEGGTYYFVDAFMEICSASDLYCDSDNHRFKACNYFRTMEIARNVRGFVKETLIKFQE